ncbi:MAG: hypothetical protein ACI3XE_05700, partial [Eubacteriales bacterium]
VSDTTLNGSDPENVRRHFRARRRKKALYIRWGALAACLLLVVLSAGVVTSVMLGGNAADREMPVPGNSGSSFSDVADNNSSSGESQPNESGERHQNAWGYLSLVGYDSADAAYLFEKTENTPFTLQVIVRLRDAEGNLSVMTNDAALREAGTYQGIPVLAQALTVRVTASDGTACEPTLTAAGTYRISLGMEELTADGKTPVSVLFESFGEFAFPENP